MVQGFSALLAAAACSAFLLTSPAVSQAAADQVFNPYTHRNLPDARAPKGKEADILKKLGAKPQSIAADAGWRAHWKEEVYPVLFGDRNAPHEILLMLDFASPESRNMWRAVRGACKKLNPAQVKVVLFQDSRELYGMDMTGLVLWTMINRPGRGAECLDWALAGWDAAKQAQRRSGHVKKFVSEYDTVVSRTDYPLVFQGMKRLGVPESQECDVADYVYEAGNVNMYQAGQVRHYYGVKKLPCVIADGKVLGDVSENSIVNAVK